MELHPNLGDPIVLRDHAGREYASRLEDLSEGLLVVARPAGLAADELDSGTEVSVVWAASDRGVMVLPTRILVAHAEGSRQGWSLVVTGPAYTAQRRRYERAAAAGPVVLRYVVGNETGAVTGTLSDVSEAAIRCTVRAGEADRFLTGSNQVVAKFRFGTADFAIPGRVQFLRATKHPAELEDLVVMFDEPVADAEALRKLVGSVSRTRPSGPARA